MAFHEGLAQRVRKFVARRKGFTEKKMFGGVGFLRHGNMCVGVWKEFLILRLGKEAAAEALTEPCVKEFDITGKTMTGWAMVSLNGLEDDDDLAGWIQQAIAFVKTLPEK